jgi:hypothetical protein
MSSEKVNGEEDIMKKDYPKIYNIINYDFNAVDKKKLFIAVIDERCYIFKKFIAEDSFVINEEIKEIEFFNMIDYNTPVDYFFTNIKDVKIKGARSPIRNISIVKPRLYSFDIKDYIEVPLNKIYAMVPDNITILTFDFRLFRDFPIEMNFIEDIPKTIEILNITFMIDNKYNLYPRLDNLPPTVKIIKAINFQCAFRSKISSGYYEFTLKGVPEKKIRHSERRFTEDEIIYYKLKHYIKLPFNCNLLYKNEIYTDSLTIKPYIYEQYGLC